MDPADVGDRTWKEEVLSLLRERWAPHEVFSLGDVYFFSDILADRHPGNQHVEEKIRQVLQQLRDDGELLFEDAEGHYSLLRAFAVANDPVLHDPSGDLQSQRLLIRDLYGRTLTSNELQERIRGFGSQKGIYKPSGSRYPLWVRQTSRGEYPDEAPQFLPDGSWTYRYSPEGREGQTDLALDTNQALLKAQKDRVPVGVFRQGSRIDGKTAYEILGLAFVESFDGTHFVLRGEPIDVAATPIVESVRPTFIAFEQDPARLSPSMRTLRDQRFATAVRVVYHDRCSLCNVGYRLRERVVGLDAAHVIPVEKKGIISDLRNGILLCKNHHVLFDQYAWTFDEEYRVVVAEDEGFRKSAAGNHILGWESKRLPNLPEKDVDFPDRKAIDWRMVEFERAWNP